MLKSIVELLNKDCLELVTSFLDMESLTSASRVSTTWRGLFTHPDIWKKKIKSDFGIDQTILSKLPISDGKESHLFCKKLYIHLYRLKQKQIGLPNFVKNIYHDQTQQNLLLMACADNSDDAFKNTPCEEQYALMVMSVYADCINIPIVFLKNNPQKKYINLIFRYAISSGNLQLVKYLLNPENQFGLRPDQEMLCSSIKLGHLQLVKYLLNEENQFDLKPYRGILYWAAGSGNFQLVKYLLNPENQFDLKPNQTTLNSATGSGSFQLVEYLLNRENQFNLKPDQDILNCAAGSGNFQLVKYLLNPENQFGLNPNQSTLYWAAKSGSFQLVKYLLNPENQFGLNPNQSTLYWAAKSNSFQLVKYLLNRENQFGLKPNESTLYCAAGSGNFQLVKYLLNPENQFGLKPDQREILYCAAQSGNLELVEYLLKENQFDLTSSQYMLSNSAVLGHLKLVKYLLNPENQFGLKPNQGTLIDVANSGNLQLMKYLLNPKNKFNLNPDQETLEIADKSGNLGLSEHLLPSHMLMQQMLQHLEKSDFGSATELLQKAYIACPSHCTMWVEHVLSHSSEFNLNRKMIRSLSDAFEKMKTPRVASQEETANSNKKTRSIHSCHQDDDSSESMDLS